MKLAYALLLFISHFVLQVIQGQDTMKTLSAAQVMEIVKLNHPVARQAALQIERAKADITIARGGFDPLLVNNLAQKTFDGTTYYRYHRPEISLPTWFGINISAGLENLSGERTDPEETTGKTSYAGISVPLAKNLLMDERRAALRTAKLFLTASAFERRNILNSLLVDAMRQYWMWVQYYQEYKVLQEVVLANQQRLNLVRTGYQLGERPAIDTTEALTQLQHFQLLRDNAWLSFRNSGLELEIFLWTNDDQPARLPVDVMPHPQDLMRRPESASIPVLQELLQVAQHNHPELLIYNARLDVSGIEKKLAFQELLPTVNFRYNQLGKGYSLGKAITAPVFENNFQYGISMSFPLRLSEGRGVYRKAKLQVLETTLRRNLKQAEITNSIKAYFNELVTIQENLILQQQMYNNYLILQRGEETRFRIGESSLFLVNARETKALEALQKLQQLKARYFITVNKLQGAAGLLVP